MKWLFSKEMEHYFHYTSIYFLILILTLSQSWTASGQVDDHFVNKILTKVAALACLDTSVRVGFLTLLLTERTCTASPSYSTHCNESLLGKCLGSDKIIIVVHRGISYIDPRFCPKCSAKVSRYKGTNNNTG